MTPTEKAIRGFCGRHADWWPSTTQVQEMLALAQPCPTCEALARTVMLDQTSHDAQRKEQEPVAWEQFYPDIGKPQIAINPETVGYVAPQRKPLTDEDVERIVREARVGEHGIGYTIARAIEAAHGIKGEA